MFTPVVLIFLSAIIYLFLLDCQNADLTLIKYKTTCSVLTFHVRYHDLNEIQQFHFHCEVQIYSNFWSTLPQQS